MFYVDVDVDVDFSNVKRALQAPVSLSFASNVPIAVVRRDTWGIEWSLPYQLPNRDARVGAVGMLGGSGPLNSPIAVSLATFGMFDASAPPKTQTAVAVPVHVPVNGRYPLKSAHINVHGHGRRQFVKASKPPNAPAIWALRDPRSLRPQPDPGGTESVRSSR